MDVKKAAAILSRMETDALAEILIKNKNCSIMEQFQFRSFKIQSYLELTTKSK